jgi:hypothetical protein
VRRFILTICLLLFLAAPSQAQRCDVNGDGNTTAGDALTVLLHAVGNTQPACVATTTTTTTTLPTSGQRHFERPIMTSRGSGTVVFDAFSDSMVVQIIAETGPVFSCSDPLLILQGELVYLIEDFLPNDNEIGIVWENHDGCGDISEGETATGTMDPPYPAGFDITKPFRIFMGIWDDDDFFDVGAF